MWDESGDWIDRKRKKHVKEREECEAKLRKQAHSDTGHSPQLA